MTPFQKFKARWRDCHGCYLCDTRKSVVLSRGTYPCDILFVGEAPGENEDALGQPFVGPAGKLLDQIVERALRGRTYRVAFTNLICCIPREEDGGKAGEPPWESIEACTPRLEEFIELVKPKVIVQVGKHAREYLSPGWRHSVEVPRDVEQVHIDHPAYILRMNVAQRTLAFQRCVVAISQVIDWLDHREKYKET